MKVTVQRAMPVPPPPSTVVLEMTGDEAELLRDYFGIHCQDKTEAMLKGTRFAGKLQKVRTLTYDIYSKLDIAHL